MTLVTFQQNTCHMSGGKGVTVMDRITAARGMVGRYHKHQKDKNGEPYIGHLTRVSDAVKHRGEKFQIVGLLHDILEDTDCTMDRVAREFHMSVASSVALLTKPKDESYSSYLKLVARDEMARAVKIADLKDNMNPDRMSRLPVATQERLLAKYKPALEMLEAI
jgi:(p)ppGpp synthase/HD superfamily hydrolase